MLKFICLNSKKAILDCSLVTLSRTGRILKNKTTLNRIHQIRYNSKNTQQNSKPSRLNLKIHHFLGISLTKYLPIWDENSHLKYFNESLTAILKTLPWAFLAIFLTMVLRCCALKICFRCHAMKIYWINVTEEMSNAVLCNSFDGC